VHWLDNKVIGKFSVLIKFMAQQYKAHCNHRTVAY